MDKKIRIIESSHRNSFPFKTYVFDAKYSRFLDSFQEMFRPLNDGVPSLRKRDPLYSSLTSDYDDENQANMRKRVRTLGDEVSSSTIKNSEIFRAGNLHQTLDTKSHELFHVREGYGSPSPSKVFYNRRHDLDLTPPKYTPSVHCCSPSKPVDLGLTTTDYVSSYDKRETAFSQSKTEALSSTEERDRKFKITSGLEKSHEFNDEKLMREKKRKCQESEHSDVSERAGERESYWERRRRNNASAKKSRDARKAREIQTQIKVDFLEKENTRMLAELLAIRHENLCLRRVLSAKM